MQGVLQFILSTLYTYSSGVSWAVLSYPSSDPQINSLNVASPSLTSEYWISTFRAYDRPVFTGSFPAWAEYSSLSAYDDTGSPIVGSSVNSFQIPSGTIDLMEHVDDTKLSRSYAVILRVYRPPNRTECLRDSEKFQVFSGGSPQPQPVAPNDQAADNGKLLEPELQEELGKIHPDLRPNRDPYKPSSRTLIDLFPNPDAFYLVSSPARKTPGIRLEGCFPSNNASQWVQYFGYMTTDTFTTATQATYEVPRSTCYDLFVMKGASDPSKYGYSALNTSQQLIYWNVGAVFPTLVLRVVDVSCSLGQCDAYGLKGRRYFSSRECRVILGTLYPTRVTFLEN